MTEDMEDPAGLESSVTANFVAADSEIEASLRPTSLTDFIGQPRVREQLQLVLTGAKLRGGTPDHILMSGPPVSARPAWR
ncbi:holliday junction DNA helicase ruvB family protein [Rhodococcus sp. MTM3W5.2]|nr:holliday junction DNA helicase ruvB family protein [Rhodococcus sp. MTM3W5.2]